MKKINLFIAVLALAGISLVTSCAKDTNPPTINFKGGSNYTSTDVTINTGDTLIFGITAAFGSAKLQSIKVVATTNNVPQQLDEITINADTYDHDFKYAFFDAGVTRLTFTITDKDNQTAEVSLSVTIQESIDSYTAVLLGGQQNATLGSFYSTNDNTVMNLATARSTPEKADMVYYYGTTNKASIVAISDAQLNDVPTFVECSTWATKNATKFKLTSGLDWASITSADKIEDAAVGLLDTHANQLRVDDIIAFETASTSTNPSKKGLFKVLEVNGTTGADRSIKIEVKIKK